MSYLLEIKELERKLNNAKDNWDKFKAKMLENLKRVYSWDEHKIPFYIAFMYARDYTGALYSAYTFEAEDGSHDKEIIKISEGYSSDRDREEIYVLKPSKLHLILPYREMWLMSVKSRELWYTVRRDYLDFTTWSLEKFTRNLKSEEPEIQRLLLNQYTEAITRESSSHYNLEAKSFHVDVVSISALNIEEYDFEENEDEYWVVTIAQQKRPVKWGRQGLWD